MAKKMKKELKDMIGKLPDNWKTLSPEDKMRIVFHKFELLRDTDLCDLRLRFRDDAWLCLEVDSEYDADDPCFALAKPVKKEKFDINRFPEYLHKIIERTALKDFDTGEKDYNILDPESESGSFEEAAESMYFVLDLLTCGYEVTAMEWYKEKHRDLYPSGDDDDDNDDYGDEDDDEDDCGDDDEDD